MTGGFFVSFMSGNSTRLAVGLADRAAYAGFALGLIVLFVVGVATGALVGRMAKDRRGVAVLALVALLLAGAAILASCGADRFAVLMLALAMGAENTIHRDGSQDRTACRHAREVGQADHRGRSWRGSLGLGALSPFVAWSRRWGGPWRHGVSLCRIASSLGGRVHYGAAGDGRRQIARRRYVVTTPRAALEGAAAMGGAGLGDVWSHGS